VLNKKAKSKIAVVGKQFVAAGYHEPLYAEIMKININTANKFLSIYKTFLLELYERKEDKKDEELTLTQKLIIGREVFSNKRSSLKSFVKRHKNTNFPAEIINAIESIEIGKWVYLKDTSHYSVFVKGDGTTGFGVLGLTDKIREIVTEPGSVVLTGIMKINGQYVADGLFVSLAVLGHNYRNEFKEIYKALKMNGEFKTKNSV
jgi:hypothetical protein